MDAAAARDVVTAHITVQGFGAPARRMRTTVHQLFLRGLDGSTHEVKAFKRTSLSLKISPVPKEVVERWHHYGVEVSDRQENAQGCDANVQMLLGADCVNQFLRHKIERNGQVASFSELGWVLSGPQVTSQQPTESQVVTIQV